MYRKLLVVAISLLMVPMAGVEGHTAGHTASDHCSTPTMTLNITAGENNQFTYDQEEYQVPRDTCIKVRLTNASPEMAHDMQIDEVEGDDGIGFVHLHANASSMAMMNILTPDADTEFLIYCTLEGHQDQGMEATLVVGEGKSLLPFSGFEVYLALISLAALPILRRK